MNSWIARYGTPALLSLALTAVGCGDDDGGGGSDAGSDAAGGGTTGTGNGTTGTGNGGTSGTTGDAGGGTGGQCSTTEAMAASIPEACAACICQNGADEAAACTADELGTCWDLVACVGENCPDKSNDLVVGACAVISCPTFTGSVVPGMAVGNVINESCLAECEPGTAGGQ